MVQAMINTIKLITEKHRMFLTFITIGTLTAVVYFSIFTVLWKWMGINYKIAVTSAYLPAISFQFITNRAFTFKNHADKILHQAAKFMMLVIINYILTILIVTGAVVYLSVSPYSGILLSIGVTVITGFLFSKLWVFRTEKNITFHHQAGE